MKRMSFLFVCLLAVLLCSCATPYKIVLKDGSERVTVDEPELNEDTNFYEYDTSDGVERQLNRDEVKELIEITE